MRRASGEASEALVVELVVLLVCSRGACLAEHDLVLAREVGQESGEADQCSCQSSPKAFGRPQSRALLGTERFGVSRFWRSGSTA